MRETLSIVYLCRSVGRMCAAISVAVELLQMTTIDYCDIMRMCSNPEDSFQQLAHRENKQTKNSRSLRSIKSRLNVEGIN